MMKLALNLASLAQTLPMLLAGMAGIFIVIGVIMLAVYLIKRLFGSRG